MLRNLLLFILFSQILLACSKDFYLKRDAKEVAYKLYRLKEADQMVRYQKKYINYYFGTNKFYHKLDSLTWACNKRALDSFILQTKIIQTSSKDLTGLKKEDYLEKKNRNNLVMKYIDSINVSELINITKKYGFPSHKRLIEKLGTGVDKKLTSSPHIIFVHTPKMYLTTVRKLVIKEYLKGRIDKNACSHIFWHLNGRIGNPFPEDYSHCKCDTLR